MTSSVSGWHLTDSGLPEGYRVCNRHINFSAAKSRFSDNVKKSIVQPCQKKEFSGIIVDSK